MSMQLQQAQFSKPSLEEQFPVHESIKVLEGAIVSKSDAWWTAVLRIQSEFKSTPQVAVYLWKKKDGKWKRAQKMTIVQSNWPKLKEAVDKMFAPK